VEYPITPLLIAAYKFSFDNPKESSEDCSTSIKSKGKIFFNLLKKIFRAILIGVLAALIVKLIIK